MSTPSNAAQLYTTVPLNQGEGQSRILELEKRPETTETDTVVCTLKPFSVDDTSAYTALSYCWGGQSATKVISVNGNNIKVAANVESALSHLGETDRRLLIWIDALCINQHDFEERNAQVAQMHLIYQKAERTVGWLGDNHDDGELALDFIRSIAEENRKVHFTEPASDVTDYERSGWRAVEKLLRRSYWRRLWVMQELALSTDFPEIACGRARLNWRLLVAGLGGHRLKYYITRLNRVRAAVRRLRKSRERLGSRDHGRHLMFLLSYSAGFETSEPRDRVYALYGLLRTNGLVDFVPDYNMSVGDVYEQATAFAIACMGGLDVLKLKPWNQDPALPSWVLDLSKLPSLQSAWPKACPWQRPKMETDQFFVPDDSRGLNVAGAIVDEVEIVHVTHPCVRRSLGQSAESEFYEYGPRTLKMPINATQFDEYWEISTKEPKEEDAPRVCKHVIEFLLEWHPLVSLYFQAKTDFWYPSPEELDRIHEAAPECNGSSEHPASEVGELQEGYGEALKPILYRLTVMFHGHHLFRTKRGFFGVGLAGMEQGDCLIAFQTTRQLHILRHSTEQEYTYVGAALLASPGSASVKTDKLTDPADLNIAEIHDLTDLFKAVKANRIQDEFIVLR